MKGVNVDIINLKIPGVTHAEIYNGSASSPVYVALSQDATPDLPGFGGCRIANHYRSNEEAREDAIRLAKGMQAKSALAGLNITGGKAVIRAGIQQKTPELMRNFGALVDALGGHYITAEDSGTNTHDMVEISRRTRYVSGLPDQEGDPSPVTAYGVWQALQTALTVQGKDLEGLTYAIRGAGGNVARYLINGLPDNESFADLHDLFGGIIKTASRIYCAELKDENKQKLTRAAEARGLEHKLEFVDPHSMEIYKTGADIFVPAALGGSISNDTLTLLANEGTQIICGPENNQLAEHASPHAFSVTYLVDYVVNSGGIILVEKARQARLQGKPVEISAVLDYTGDRIANNTRTILGRSQGEDSPTQVIAEEMVEEILTEREQRRKTA